MDQVEFDKFAEEYTRVHANNTRLTGEDPSFFARYKIEALAGRWYSEHTDPPDQILDFGTGIGNSLPYFRSEFPKAKVTALDVSHRSLTIAQKRFPGAADFVSYSGDHLSFEDKTFDLIFSACVFHHIDAAEHVKLFTELRRVLKDDGLLLIFEHNPYNPVTRHIVNTCPFDENAVLIRAGEFKHRQEAAGLRGVTISYTAFFPAQLSALRSVESFLTKIPLGAQYYTLAKR